MEETANKRKMLDFVNPIMYLQGKTYKNKKTTKISSNQL